jgi:hypothetical protein
MSSKSSQTGAKHFRIFRLVILGFLAIQSVAWRGYSSILSCPSLRAICNDWNHVGESLPLAEAGEKYAVFALPLLRGHPATPRSRLVALRAFICLLPAGCSVPANAFSLVRIAWPAHPARGVRRRLSTLRRGMFEARQVKTKLVLDCGSGSTQAEP